MEPSPSLRVVRGPDWSWGDQDGGEGGVGTVVEVGKEGKSVLVQWDCGIRARYRSGAEDKFDLRVFDTAPTGLTFPEVICCGCYVEGVAGMYWKCAHCYEYHLCHSCYQLGRHCQEHPFFRIQSERQTHRIKVSSRVDTRQVEAKGIFSGVVVARGHNWRFGDQDGGAGMTGKVLCIEGWKDETARSVAKVKWNATGVVNIYRVGHRGKADLVCSTSTIGSNVYYCPEHLPTLGIKAGVSYFDENEIVAGDVIKVELEPDVMKMLHEARNLWDVDKAQVCGCCGIVWGVLTDQRIVACSPATILLQDTVIKLKHCRVGETVRISSDYAEVYRLNSKQWNDDMVLILGQLGCVTEIIFDCRIAVAVNGRVWTVNALCVLPAPGETVPDSPVKNLQRTTNVVPVNHRELLKAKGFTDEVLDGDLVSLSRVLSSNVSPLSITAKSKLMGYYATEGIIPALKTVLQHDVNPSSAQLKERLPLAILCLQLRQESAFQAVIEAGTDENDDYGPLIKMACLHGLFRPLKFLLKHPQALLSLQAGIGSSTTVLHQSVICSRSLSVALLLAVRTDPLTCQVDPPSIAARLGFVSVMEQLAVHVPNRLDIKAGKGITPLQVAVWSNHIAIVNLLLTQNSVDINGKDDDEMTALHVAAFRSHFTMIECLVGWGASLNCLDRKSNTPLNLVIMHRRSAALTSPQLTEVHEKLSRASGGRPVEEYVAVVCFLVREGADWNITDATGKSSREVLSHDIAALITDYVKDHSRSFHGSLRNTQQQRMCELPQRYVLNSPSGTVGAAVQPLSTSDSKDFTRLVTETDVKSSFSVKSLDKKQTSVTNKQLCMLCEEKPTTVKFSPCGHTIMCNQCAERAKRCLQCKASVESKSIVPS